MSDNTSLINGMIIAIFLFGGALLCWVVKWNRKPPASEEPPSCNPPPKPTIASKAKPEPHSNTTNIIAILILGSALLWWMDKFMKKSLKKPSDSPKEPHKVDDETKTVEIIPITQTGVNEMPVSEVPSPPVSVPGPTIAPIVEPEPGPPPPDKIPVPKPPPEKPTEPSTAGPPRKEEPSEKAIDQVSKPPTTVKVLRADLVCQWKNGAWNISIEVSRRDYDDGWIVEQNGKSLNREENGERQIWQVGRLSGKIAINGADKFDLNSPPHIFKLSGDYVTGRYIKSQKVHTNHNYLAIVPADWRRDNNQSGPPPRPPENVEVDDDIWTAHYFFLELDWKIAFIDQCTIYPETEESFKLIGDLLKDDAEREGPLFIGEPPKIQCDRWNSIKSIIFGEERPGMRRDIKTFTPEPLSGELELPWDDKLPRGGRFFLRFYDKDLDLIHSCDFRWAPDLFTIERDDTPLLPCVNGYQLAKIIVRYRDGARLVFQDNSPIQIETPDSETTILHFPPTPGCGVEVFEFLNSNQTSVHLALLVPRIWWMVREEFVDPANFSWIDRQLEFVRNDFDAASTRILFLKLPRTRLIHEIQAGFQQTPLRSFKVEFAGIIQEIPLREFTNSVPRDSLGEHPFDIMIKMDNKKYITTCGVLIIRLRYDEEEITFTTEKDAKDFLESKLNILVPHMTYDELVKAFPDKNFPAKIYQCSHCKIYVKAEQGYPNPTSAITQHLENDHHNQEKSFEVITDIKRIRSKIIKNLPECYRCKLCKCELKAVERAKHIWNNHRSELFRLC